MTDVEKFLAMQIVGIFAQAEQSGLGTVISKSLDNIVIGFDGKEYEVTVKERVRSKEDVH